MLGLVFDFFINLDLWCFKFSDPTPSFSQPLRLSSSKINQRLNFEHTHLQFFLKIVTTPPTKSMEANFVVIFFLNLCLQGQPTLILIVLLAPSRFVFQSCLNLEIVLYYKYYFIIFIGYSWLCIIDFFFFFVWLLLAIVVVSCEN